ncbi:hypothetical protein ACWKSP_23415 [Micromonosporaceae bacterium Da 78-11]
MIGIIRRMRLRVRLLLAFGLFCLLVLAMTWVGVAQSNKQTEIVDEVGQAVREMLAGVGDRAASLNGSSRELADVSQRMEHQAVDTSNRAGVVAGAADEVSGNVATMASAAEEMVSAIATTRDAATTRESARELGAMADDLNTLVTSFRY